MRCDQTTRPTKRRQEAHKNWQSLVQLSISMTSITDLLMTTMSVGLTGGLDPACKEVLHDRVDLRVEASDGRLFIRNQYTGIKSLARGWVSPCSRISLHQVGDRHGSINNYYSLTIQLRLIFNGPNKQLLSLF